MRGGMKNVGSQGDLDYVINRRDEFYVFFATRPKICSTYIARRVRERERERA